MSDSPEANWVYIGRCNVCKQGLARVRVCAGANDETHFYALCDECEAIWVEPDVRSEALSADMDVPICPICSVDLYGAQAHWAEVAELRGTPWAVAKLSPGVNNEPVEPVDDSVDHQVEPELPGSRKLSVSDDLAYGQDDPKPGC